MEYHLERKYKIIILTVVALVWLFAMGRVAYSFYDGETVLRGVHIGKQDFSGLTQDDLRVKLSAFESRLSAQGFTFAYQDDQDKEENLTIYPFIYKSDGADFREFASLDVEATFNEIWGIGRRGTWFRKVIERLATRLYGASPPAVVTVDINTFREVMHLNIAALEHPARDARVVYENGAFAVEREAIGVVYDVDRAVDKEVSLMRKLELSSVPMERSTDKPKVTEMDLLPFIPGLSRIVEAGSITVTHPVTSTELGPWILEKEQIARALVLAPREKGVVTIEFDPVILEKWVQEIIAPAVAVEPHDAKFKIEGERVVEFQSSQTGVGVDLPGLIAALGGVAQERYNNPQNVPGSSSLVTLALVTTEPAIKTGDVNNLGIKEKLGVGTSSWKGSPGNRIKNIRNGMNKLNGILIKPGEEFSLLAALQPFTLAGGYLPELVIKGDKIIPEIGGGLCQIGTTSFRMAMNSGLPVTQRTNHGLVVTYYNDPSNGNPGTDATIYDPAPDFRFLNDTGNYILWTTHMNDAASKLEFTLWGTSDGRKGSYSAPLVQSWIGTGPARIIETTDLPVGKRVCQSRHPGAVASFTYTIELPSGEKKEKIYTSHYRPLPEICSVGVEKKTDASPAPVAPADAPETPPVSVDDLSV